MKVDVSDSAASGGTLVTPQAGDGLAPRVVVAVATYRRTKLLGPLLESLVTQVREYGPTASVLLVDNNPQPEAAEAIRDYPAGLVRCVHEPTPGIAAARNRALDDCSDADAIVFIDDDELPDDKWLCRLVDCWRVWDCAVVSGPVVSRFESPPDKWVAGSGAFDRQRAPTGSLRPGARTNNILFDMKWLKASGLRFDERFGLTGGSDTMLTRLMAARGAEIRWCDEAEVSEIVPAHRSVRRWVLQRAIRTGNVWTRVHLLLSKSAWARWAEGFDLAARGAYRALRGSARVIAGVVSRDVRLRACGECDIASSVGVISGLFGYVKSEYSRSSESLDGAATLDRHSKLAEPELTDSLPALSLTVSVGIPTFHRPQLLLEALQATLRGIENAEAQFRQCTFNVVVVDNDPEGSGRATVSALASSVIRYAVETDPGISAARNRILDECERSDLLAFVDDDEAPYADWLTSLLRRYQIDRPAGVYGRIAPEYEGPVDPWVAAGSFFGRFDAEDGAELKAASTNNLLLDLNQIRRMNIRFDERLGRSGGEDTLLTRTMVANGARIVFCQESVVGHRINMSRVNRRWVLQRSWSHGNSHAVVSVLLAKTPSMRLLARATAGIGGAIRVAGGAGRGAVGAVLRSPRHQARGLRTAFRGAGMVSGALGYTYQEYAQRRRKGWF